MTDERAEVRRVLEVVVDFAPRLSLNDALRVVESVARVLRERERRRVETRRAA